jgi:hypothetical protein
MIEKVIAKHDLRDAAQQRDLAYRLSKSARARRPLDFDLRRRLGVRARRRSCRKRDLADLEALGEE